MNICLIIGSTFVKPTNMPGRCKESGLMPETSPSGRGHRLETRQQAAPCVFIQRIWATSVSETTLFVDSLGR